MLGHMGMKKTPASNRNGAIIMKTVAPIVMPSTVVALRSIGANEFK